MPTLADMQASIAAEIYRDDLTTQIAAEIARAIRHYQRQRFYFNESRQITFNTVSGQEFYGAAAEARIPNLIEIDYIQATQNARPMSLDMVSAEYLDWSTGTPASGPPSLYAYYEQTLRISPVPNQAYPVRIAALYRVDPPASTTDATSPWMNDAEELIRSRAKRNLYLHSLGDQGMAAGMKAAEDEALDALIRETASRTQVHSFAPSCV